MVGEVNKIIYNMLVSGRGVHLPGVGTLFIERQPARKISDTKLMSPRNVVSFTSQAQAPSLVDEISNIAKCEQPQSQDIYERWLSKTRTDNTVVIAGIGKLVDKSFTIDEAFNTTLNPQGNKVLVLRRKQKHTWLYVLSGVCALFAIGIFAYLMWFSSPMTSVEGTTAKTVVATSTTDKTEAVADNIEATDNIEEGTQPSETAADTATEPTLTPATELSFYVVMGVFSEQANAERAIEQAKKEIGDVTCTILPFKGKHMVTIFGSNNRAECNTYANAYRDIYPNLWIYEVK